MYTDDRILVALYGVSWKKNSCALNSETSALQFVVLNLNNEGLELFRALLPDIAIILEGLNDGTMSSRNASWAIEQAVHPVIWNPSVRKSWNNITKTEQGEYADIRNHKFSCALYALRALQGCEVSNADHQQKMFKTTVSKKSKCMRCGFEETSLVEMKCLYFDRLQHAVDVNLNLQSALCVATKPKCSSCEEAWDTQFRVLETPLVLNAMLGGMHGSQKVKVNSASAVGCDQTVVPPEIVLGETEYTLIATEYLGGAHFTTIGRRLVEGQYYHHDGMKDNAQWMKVLTNTFPIKFKGRNIDQAVYVQKKYIKFSCVSGDP